MRPDNRSFADVTKERINRGVTSDARVTIMRDRKQQSNLRLTLRRKSDDEEQEETYQLKKRRQPEYTTVEASETEGSMEWDGPMEWTVAEREMEGEEAVENIEREVRLLLQEHENHKKMESSSSTNGTMSEHRILPWKAQGLRAKKDEGIKIIEDRESIILAL